MKVVKPTVFPKPGTYSTNKVHVNMMSFTKDAHIYYTLDGSDPNQESATFNIADGLLTLQLDEGEAQKDFYLKAIAIKEGSSSDVAAFHFSIRALPNDEYFYTILQEKEAGSPAIIRIEDEYQVKMYFVIGSERAILIDAGLNKENDLKGFLDMLADGLPYEAVITHAHPDHDAQAQSLIDQGITVYLNSEEKATLDQFGGTLTGFVDFNEGHIFDLGDCQLKAYKIPGHTKGHIILLDEKNGLLFASDAFGNNRNTLMDTAFLHLAGGEESTMDRFLAVLQNFRHATRGKINKIFFGHNDHVLNENYLENLEKAVQQAIDFGEEALSPTLRPAKECMGSSKISLIGNYMTDLDWVGINIEHIYSDNYTSENIDTLSAVFIKGGSMEPAFDPKTENYTLRLDQDSAEVEILVLATSTRAQNVEINGVAANQNEYAKMGVHKNMEIVIQVVSPNGKNKKQYTIVIK
ncbi:MBL fold metallo-hydrolase [Bacillus sp. FJAT-50079]|uniref:MBL fold metallo-hydrolase n=1 Tax=Bacillus sp. FJAT-50079 TaxID=2833577 RepID=UPI001BC9E67B|nr:MBL fold metallo-hydrolase [Bacillus sp. FJAT-50079]MBS4209352.1 MBL fold metallo-hydrolase [Bacillus sp. FJAT-50079]